MPAVLGLPQPMHDASAQTMTPLPDDRDLLNALLTFQRRLLAIQIELPPETMRILRERAWDLYE